MEVYCYSFCVFWQNDGHLYITVKNGKGNKYIIHCICKIGCYNFRVVASCKASQPWLNNLHSFITAEIAHMTEIAVI